MKINEQAFVAFCPSSFLQRGGFFRCWYSNVARLAEHQACILEWMASYIRGDINPLRALRCSTLSIHFGLQGHSHPYLLYKSPHFSFLWDCGDILNSNLLYLQFCLYFFSFLLSILSQKCLLSKINPTTIHVDLFPLSLRLCSIICLISLASSSYFCKMTI